MDSNVLQWPGLWDLKTFIVDPDTNRVYCKENPLPPQKHQLDSIHNKYVRLSEVLDLFEDEMRTEAEWTLREIQRTYNIGKVIHVTVTMQKSADDGGRAERKVTSYISVAALMVFAIVWPFCKPFQVILITCMIVESSCGFVCCDCFVFVTTKMIFMGCQL
jgi:hypothetical protein